MSVFRDLMGSIRVRSRPSVASPARPTEDELALQILRKKYREYLQCTNPSDKETMLFQLVPLFNNSCMKMEVKLLVDKFAEVYDFAENVAFIFVRHVTHLAQNAKPGVLLEYFVTDPCAGMVLMKALAILARGPEELVNSMMSSSLSCILVRCLSIFLDLPSPAVQAGSASPSLRLPPVRRPTPGDIQLVVKERADLQKLFIRLLNRLLRYNSAVVNLMEFQDLSMLFAAISSPCSAHNKIWRKAASETLMTICRHNLTGTVPPLPLPHSFDVFPHF